MEHFPKTQDYFETTFLVNSKKASELLPSFFLLVYFYSNRQVTMMWGRGNQSEIFLENKQLVLVIR